ncbi:unnamed protein product [Lactuca saligna]|uniref:Vacuolar fusion protein MON1 homolog n=1 Tax=Lactuca saligna TaxID=75948 RepID=A0AA36E153_LACSI|nr:unnamed protein product [Lactuca saligna]
MVSTVRLTIPAGGGIPGPPVVVGQYKVNACTQKYKSEDLIAGRVVDGRSPSRSPLRQNRKLDEMYDQLRSEYDSVKRSAIQPANNFFSRGGDSDLFSSPTNMMDNRDQIFSLRGQMSVKAGQQCIEGVKMSKHDGWGVMASHRSGETEDTFIADLSVCLATFGSLNPFFFRGDQIHLIRAGKHQVAFLVKRPIYLVCISCTEEPYESLRSQLELLYGQMVLILTESVSRYFEKNRKFDITPLLGGTDAVFSSLFHSFRNPASFLHAYTYLPLPRATRQTVVAILQDVSDSGVIYSMLMRHLSHSPPYVYQDTMPFLHAYVHYFDDDTHLVLLTSNSDAFFHLKYCRMVKLMRQCKNVKN